MLFECSTSNRDLWRVVVTTHFVLLVAIIGTNPSVAISSANGLRNATMTLKRPTGSRPTPRYCITQQALICFPAAILFNRLFFLVRIHACYLDCYCVSESLKVYIVSFFHFTVIVILLQTENDWRISNNQWSLVKVPKDVFKYSQKKLGESDSKHLYPQLLYRTSES